MDTTTRAPYLDSLSANKDGLASPTKVHQKQQRPWYYPLSEFVDRIYMQFLLVTTLYVMEPWERLLVFTIFFLVISLVSYSAFIYIPYHVHHMLQSSMPSLTAVFMQ